MLYIVVKWNNKLNQEVAVNADGTITGNVTHGELFNSQDANDVAKKYNGIVCTDQSLEREPITPKQAAEVIGCSVQHVRTLIRSGKIKATKRKTPTGHYWSITPAEARRYRDKPINQGYPRGKKRTKQTKGEPR